MREAASGEEEGGWKNDGRTSAIQRSRVKENAGHSGTGRCCEGRKNVTVPCHQTLLAVPTCIKKKKKKVEGIKILLLMFKIKLEVKKKMLSQFMDNKVTWA